MPEPLKHHYIPAFFLRQWARQSDAQLTQFSKPYGNEVKSRDVFPENTGFEERLYTVEGLPEDQAHKVESGFMSFVDNEAAKALAKIAAGDATGWDQATRSDWTRFMLSLRFRNPEVIADLKGHMRDIVDATFADVTENYAVFRRPGDPETAEEFFARIEGNPAEGAAMHLAQNIIDNERVGPDINNMRWHRHLFPDARHTFLTSDRPFDWPKGLADPGAYIALPVGPRTLFTAAHGDWLAKEIRQANPSRVIDSVNKTIVAHARRFVWGVDASQLQFIRRYMGTAPDRPVITEEQKRAAINVGKIGRG
jgi:hypothetical protein